MEDLISLARTAYDAYGKLRNWQDSDGSDIAMWDQLPEHIQIAWIAAVVAVKNKLKPENPDRG